MVRYGISSWIVRDAPAQRAVELMASNGFREVELSACAASLVQEWERDPEGVGRKLESAGLDVVQIHTPDNGRALDALDESTRQASLAANVTYFDLARRTGAAWIVIHPTGAKNNPPTAPKEARVARILDSLKTLAEQSARFGIGLAVENMPSKKADSPAATMAELRRTIEGLGDHVGLCFDIGHAVMKGLDPVEELRAAGDKLISLHLHDVDAKGKDHFIPGEGVIDWDAVLAMLDAMDFRGVRTLEICPPEGNVEQRVRDTAAVMRAWESR